MRISRVDVAAALPGGAKAAFDRVLQATQTADRTIADAKTDAARTAAEARQQRLQIQTNAEAQAAEQRTEATSAAALMVGLADQMQGSASIIQRRSIYDARTGALLGRAREVNAVASQEGSRLLLSGPGTPK